GLRRRQLSEILSSNQALTKLLRLSERLLLGQILLIRLQWHWRAFEPNEDMARFHLLVFGFMLVVISTVGSLVGLDAACDIAIQSVGQKVVGLERDQLAGF